MGQNVKLTYLRAKFKGYLGNVSAQARKIKQNKKQNSTRKRSILGKWNFLAPS